jgi:hypothetical protein
MPIEPAGPHDVIDLRAPGPARVRVRPDENPFVGLARDERKRLIVRVLCELVAYEELEAVTGS